ncbi:MAG: regulator of ribonuclease [Blastococcus sp.]|nr:regulator of ribonuclease [Blastococcus sp.]
MTSPTTVATTDLCDAHPEAQVCEPDYPSFGGRATFSGPIATLKVFEDNSLVREAMGQPGQGRVLVVDGGGSLRCSLFGGNLAVAAASNGWAGVVVHGAVRDVGELAAQPIGVRALALYPRKSERGLHSGQVGLPVIFAGVVFREGEWLCADRDGIVVLPEAPSPG